MGSLSLGVSREVVNGRWEPKRSSAVGQPGGCAVARTVTIARGRSLSDPEGAAGCALSLARRSGRPVRVQWGPSGAQLTPSPALVDCILWGRISPYPVQAEAKLLGWEAILQYVRVCATGRQRGRYGGPHGPSSRTSLWWKETAGAGWAWIAGIAQCCSATDMGSSAARAAGLLNRRCVRASW